MKNHSVLSCAFSFCLFCVAGAQTVSVSGLCNSFGSGYGDAPAPAGGGGGLPPIEIALNGRTQLNISAFGTVSPDGVVFNGPDGVQWTFGFPNPNDILSHRSISGIVNNKNLFLAGVFLDNGVPGSAPPRLDFTNVMDFLSITPLLGQTFYIGDGVSQPTGTPQVFNAPAGATKLFLGFEDAFEFQGLPGSYANNAGSLQVSVQAVPEPTTIAVVALGAAIFLLRKRSRV